MVTLYADPEHRPPAREEVQVGLGVCWTTGMSCNRGHWHSSCSHGTTVLGPGDAGVAVFRQRLRHQSLQQLREPLATRARSNPLSRQPTRPWPVLELKPQDGPDLKKLKFHCARFAPLAQPRRAISKL